MANTSARMLRLLSLLQTHRFWPGSELADRLEVSQRTLRRDVDRLRELGYPVDANRGVAGGYQLQSGAAMPPLLLDDEEAVAIAVGLRTAAGGAVDGIEETSMRALTKVIQVMPPRLRRRVEALRSYTVPTFWGGATTNATVDAMSLTVIASSCRDDERLRFGYKTYDGEESKRHVEPHRLVSLGRRWYLVAWDVERHDWRTFRADRMVDPKPTGARFRQRELPGGDAGAFVRDRLNQRPTQYEAIMEIKAPATKVKEHVAHWGTVEPVTDETCRLIMKVDSFEWPTVVLGVIGAEFTVVGPPELKDYIREMGKALLRSTEG
ncbi:helix-turn-helix transcriptional regulator [Kibdelosporangium aridum]|uniref:Predicted DNA-binding transcriptional regulator YafY, contains an HTH and WYL domains n=1 Tax=Kibdelosporangium aridum TaxID=2030 RepID=A0A1W2FJ22_KIBAR|nr:YafY family protein [Kibdelosporangium aridum]SMD21941.1 Predicted DNA-binding transcriptional regulator YafY, contains an HTH and WYL domains [Kibdelosporangium aridum]